ncbi:hypothetical protein TNCV_2281 [Trichonephila clavipes]|nr:hypothetical protein TNCV_2281 [Trichonephila clavipes]
MRSTWQLKQNVSVCRGKGFFVLSNVIAKVTDQRPTCCEFKPSTVEDQPCKGRRCTLNMSRFMHSSVDVVRKFGEGGRMAGRRAVLLARWIVRSVPLEIVESSGHEKAPTREKPGLERPGRPREERIEASCGKHF